MFLRNGCFFYPCSIEGYFFATKLYNSKSNHIKNVHLNLHHASKFWIDPMLDLWDYNMYSWRYNSQFLKNTTNSLWLDHFSFELSFFFFHLVEAVYKSTLQDHNNALHFKILWYMSLSASVHAPTLNLCLWKQCASYFFKFGVVMFDLIGYICAIMVLENSLNIKRNENSIVNKEIFLDYWYLSFTTWHAVVVQLLGWHSSYCNNNEVLYWFCMIRIL